MHADKRPLESDPVERKKARVQAGQPSAGTKSRQDIGEVFELWQSVHGPYDEPSPTEVPADLAQKVRSLSKSESAQLALAPSWAGFARKVRHHLCQCISDSAVSMPEASLTAAECRHSWTQSERCSRSPTC